MKDILEQAGQAQDPAEKIMMEATHFGLRRLREWSLGMGYAWPLVFNAVLVLEGREWKFHTLHWAMPVD